MEAMPDVPDVTAADDVLEAVVAVEVSASDMLDVTGIDRSVVDSNVVVKEPPLYVLVTVNIAGVVFDSDVVGSELLWHVLDDY